LAARFANMSPWVRDRLMADDKLLFKVLAEIAIDFGAQLLFFIVVVCAQ
jgi:hypothetical protein